MNLKSLFIVGAIASALAGPALAADLPVRTPPPPPFVPPPVFTWTGFYVGANAGYAFGDENRIDVTGFGSVRTKSDGFTGGGQVGYNYQFGLGSGIVLGVEADAEYVGTDKTGNFGTPAATITRLHTSLDYLGTIRGRLGYAFDRFLVYGTGGFAYGGETRRATVFNGAGTSLASASYDSTGTGYAFGGGVEYAVPTDSFLNFFHSSAVTTRVEYLHYNLDSDKATVVLGPTAYSVRFKDSGDIVRAGINYKF